MYGSVHSLLRWMRCWESADRYVRRILKEDKESTICCYDTGRTMTSELKWDLGVKLTNQIKAGDVAAVAKTSAEIFQNIVESGTGELEKIKLRAARVLSVAMRAGFDAGANPHQLNAARSNSLDNIIKVKSREQLAKLLLDDSTHIARLVGEEQNTVAERLPHAIKYVHEHAAEGVSRADVADVLGCSVSHVSRIFSKVLGKHFKDFVLECRIDKAKQLLTETDDKIIDIAFAIGFSAPNYFGSCFKRLTGVTPGQYRRTEG